MFANSVYLVSWNKTKQVNTKQKPNKQKEMYNNVWGTHGIFSHLLNLQRQFLGLSQFKAKNGSRIFSM